MTPSLICNDRDGVLGISRILKLRNQLLSHRGNNIQSSSNSDPKSLEDILRKGFNTGVSYMYSSLFEVSQWCKAVDLFGKRMISCFGEIIGSGGIEGNIFYLILESSYSSNPGITGKNDITLIHALNGQEGKSIEVELPCTTKGQRPGRQNASSQASPRYWNQEAPS